MGDGAVAGIMGGFFVAYILILVFTLALSIAFYIFCSLGLYSHAKRHNIANAWLAWLPVGNYWTYGKLADIATANKPGKKLSYTKWMLGLGIGSVASSLIYVILAFAMLGSVMSSALLYDEEVMIGSMFIWIAVIMVFAFVIYGLSIAISVIWSLGMYHVYRMYCTKGMSLTFAILGGVFGLHGIFLFAIRNKPLLPPQPAYTDPSQGWPQQNYYNPQQPPQGYYPSQGWPQS